MYRETDGGKAGSDRLGLVSLGIIGDAEHEIKFGSVLGVMLAGDG